MTYNEIMQLSDIQEKQDKLKEFYKDEIGVTDWLSEESKSQKIRFEDRWEYKKNGKLHNLKGPAIDFNNGTKGYYYIDGNPMEFDAWKKESTNILREKKLNRAIKNES